MPRKKTTPWETAKPILQKDYQEGRVTDLMKPSNVWNMREEFKAVEYKNFRTNFASMKKRIREHKERSDIDEAGFVHDMSLFTLAKDSEGFWNGSDAERLLKEDISKNFHEQMKPKFLWVTRPEYQEFGLKTFRGHIHQEVRSQRETNYWIVKRRKKKQAEEAKRNGQRYVNVEDMDFFFDPVLEM